MLLSPSFWPLPPLDRTNSTWIRKPAVPLDLMAGTCASLPRLRSFSRFDVILLVNWSVLVVVETNWPLFIFSLQFSSCLKDRPRKIQPNLDIWLTEHSV